MNKGKGARLKAEGKEGSRGKVQGARIKGRGARGIFLLDG
jgi:hypothetical protein